MTLLGQVSEHDAHRRLISNVLYERSRLPLDGEVLGTFTSRKLVPEMLKIACRSGSVLRYHCSGTQAAVLTTSMSRKNLPVTVFAYEEEDE